MEGLHPSVQEEVRHRRRILARFVDPGVGTGLNGMARRQTGFRHRRRQSAAAVDHEERRLVPEVPPASFGKISSTVQEKDGLITPWRVLPISILYNTELVKTADLPRPSTICKSEMERKNLHPIRRAIRRLRSFFGIYKNSEATSGSIM